MTSPNRFAFPLAAPSRPQLAALRLLLLVLACLTFPSLARADRGRESMGTLSVRLIHATNTSPSKNGVALDDTIIQRLRKDAQLQFQHYRHLGQDRQTLYRSYENWLQPIRDSKDILLRFEPLGTPSANQSRLDIELWLSQKKTLKTNATITHERPLFILGPAWREGRLILMITLTAAP